MKLRMIPVLAFTGLALYSSVAFGQVANDADGNFDSTSYVETENNSTTNTTSDVTTTNTNTNNTTVDSTSTNTNTNTNNTTINSTNTNTNTNTNNTTVNSTSTNTNNNTINQTTNSTVNQTTDSTIGQTVNSTSNVTTNNTNTSTSNNTNTNTNTNTNNNNNKNDSTITQKIESPPPSAIAPTIMLGGNDTCTVTYSGAVQTQIVGISGGGHIRDLNCERLKNSKTLYNMGMKVAAVALMCQDAGVYRAMEMAGTPCPFDGSIGLEAKEKWDLNPELQPTNIEQETRRNDQMEGAVKGILGGGLLFLLLGL